MGSDPPREFIHWALEALTMVLTGVVAVVMVLVPAVSCRLRALAGMKLTGLLPNKDRLWGFRKSGVFTMLGAEPDMLVLANSRFPFPSRVVMGKDPLEARAWMVASAPPKPAVVRFSKAPPVLNCDEDMRPGLIPAAAAAIAARPPPLL